MELAFLADVPHHARFAIGSREEYLRLPIRVRDAMLEHMERWRAQEKPD